ncbi:hypothetical protein ACL07V_34950 [Streptomyces sp. MB22_4]|uniref:hypothetical protein n=1 Tax=Streptomyces sp. MB22_4 TaxID=3383120 RepID=UPI0039A0503C
MGFLDASPADEAACHRDEGVVEFEASFPPDGKAFELMEEGEGLDELEFAGRLDPRHQRPAAAHHLRPDRCQGH